MKCCPSLRCRYTAGLAFLWTFASIAVSAYSQAPPAPPSQNNGAGPNGGKAPGAQRGAGPGTAKAPGTAAGQGAAGQTRQAPGPGPGGAQPPAERGGPSRPPQANTTPNQTTVSDQVSITTTDAALKDDPIAANLETLMQTAINDTQIKVSVKRLDGAARKRVYIAVLAGTLTSKQASMRAQAKAELVQKSSGLDNLVVINTIDGEDPLKGDIEVSYLWQCGFIQGDTAFDNKINLVNIADGLNTMFPCLPSGPPVVNVKDTNLWLHGPQNIVRKVRAILAMIDAPTPEVKLEVWAIQYAGSQKDIGARIQALNDEIAQAQHAAEMAKNALAFAVQKNATALLADDSFIAMRKIGFDVDPASSMSLLESLICIGISDHRGAMMKDAAAALKQLLPKDATWITKGLQNDSDFFPNLTLLLAQPGGSSPANTSAADQLSVRRFATSLKTYIAFIDALGVYGPTHFAAPDTILEQNPSAPEALGRESLTFDRLLEHLVDALAADMQKMFFAPLLDRAQHWNYHGQGGIGLAGKTDIVVNSRLHADVTAALELYAEHQTPRTLGSDVTTSAKAAAAIAQDPAGATKAANGTGKPTSNNGSAPTASSAPPPQENRIGDLMQGLTPLEKGAALSLFQPTADISYYKVAPGIEIHVTPAMTPDGTSANLKLDATFGEDTSSHGAANTLSNTFRPPDSVKQHRVQTVANVGGFNLFEVSSFNMDTLYPRPPFIVPVLGNLPLFGNMFRLERGANRTYHQSVILVNATLIPRSLGLVGFYGSNFAGQDVIARAPTSREVGGSKLLDFSQFIRE